MRRRFLSLSLVWLLLAVPAAPAQDAKPSEYQIKAAFLFNFAKFIQWPPNAFKNPTSPLIIGILGENPFGDDLTRMVQNKRIDEHPLLVKAIASARDVTGCHIVFISNSEKDRLPDIMKNLKGASILTVGEAPRFTENGGMIKFFLESTKIRFEINNDAASEVGLKISSKLLALSVRP